MILNAKECLENITKRTHLQLRSGKLSFSLTIHLKKPGLQYKVRVLRSKHCKSKLVHSRLMLALTCIHLVLKLAHQVNSRNQM